MRNIGRAVICLCFIALLTLPLTPRSAHAAGATITVTTTDDELNEDGDCSLREAIEAANTDAAVDACPAGSGADTIILPAGSYRLRIPGTDDWNEGDNSIGDLDIVGDLSIIGAGAEFTNINGACAFPSSDRVFEIRPGGYSVTIEGITIKNGSNSWGGGIYKTDGNLTIEDSILTGNQAEWGSAIFNGYLDPPEDAPKAGTVTIINSAVAGNYSMFQPFTRAIFSGGGDVTVIGSTIANNKGGGVDVGGGTLEIRFSRISDNTSLHGAGGIVISSSDAAIINTVVSNNYGGTLGWFGGGIEAYGSELRIINSTITSNTGNQGGGIQGVGSNTTIIGSTISDNVATGGYLEQMGEIFNGNGGGIYYRNGTLTIVSSTISGNRATGRFSKDYFDPDRGYARGYAYFDGMAVAGGGGIYNAGGTLTITSSTIYGNTVAHSGNDWYSGGVGGGIVNGPSIIPSRHSYGRPSPTGPPGVVNIRNTIIAGNATDTGRGHDCLGSINNQGYNLIQDIANCIIPGAADHTVTGLNPLLGLLADNGGPTQTHALRDASPAINAGDCAEEIDQRGAPRDVTCDIGAYEWSAKQPTVVQAQPPSLPESDPVSLTCDISVETRLHVGYQGIAISNGDLYDTPWGVGGPYWWLVGRDDLTVDDVPFYPSFESGDTFDVVDGPWGMPDYYDCTCLPWWKITLHKSSTPEELGLENTLSEENIASTGWSYEWWDDYRLEPLDIPNSIEAD